MTFSAEQLRSVLVVGTQDTNDVAALVDQAVAANISMVILVERQQQGENLVALAQQVRDLTLAGQVPFLIADDVALATLVNADGVYVTNRLEANSIAAEAQAAGLYVGVAINNRTELPENVPAGVAFYSVSPVYPSRHVDTNLPIAHLAGLTTIVQNSQRPILALGGITVARLKDVVRMGVYGAAGTDVFVQATDLDATVAAFNETFAGMTTDQALANTRYGIAIPGKHTNAVQGELH